jgi:hypothetical protein
MLSIQQIENLFNEFNKLYFENQLVKPRSFEYTFKKSFLGQFSWHGKYKLNGYSVIYISSAWEMSDFEIEKVLIHEMVHAWQWVNGLESDGHGRYFKMKARQINHVTNFKYDIGRITNIESQVSLKDKNKTYKGAVIIYDNLLYPGKKFVAICPLKSAHSFKDGFKNHSRVKNLKVYYGEGKVYNNMHKSVQRLNGYYYSQEEFNKLFASTLIREI